MNRRVPSLISYLLLAGLASYYFTSLWFELNYEFRGAPWEAILKGTAATPFQYRVLVPWLVNGLMALRVAGRGFVSAQALLFWIQCGSVFLLVLAFQSCLGLFFEKRLAPLFSLLLFLVLPFNYLLDRFLAIRYPTDLPAVLFFTIGLVLLYRRNWLLFYPLFIIATLNRETSCFLSVVYLFTALGRENRRKIIIHLGAQILLWTAIKYCLYMLYRANPGSEFFQGHIQQNLGFLMNPAAYPLFFSNLGYLWVPVLMCRRLIPDHFARRSVLVIYPYFLGMFVIGNMYELRIYGELIPLVLTALLLIVKELLGKEITPRERGGEAGSR